MMKHATLCELISVLWREAYPLIVEAIAREQADEEGAHWLFAALREAEDAR